MIFLIIAPIFTMHSRLLVWECCHDSRIVVMIWRIGCIRAVLAYSWWCWWSDYRILLIFWICWRCWAGIRCGNIMKIWAKFDMNIKDISRYLLTMRVFTIYILYQAMIAMICSSMTNRRRFIDLMDI